MRFVPVSEEIRAQPAFVALREVWPEFLRHDPISIQHWDRLYSERSEFQFALLDENGELLAEANSLPVEGQPVGWDAAVLNGFAATQPDRLCALAIAIGRNYQGRRLATATLEHMRGLAIAHGFRELIAPVRPTLKHLYPLIPTDHYVAWRREDGSLFDPWLRTHERLGAELIAVAGESMRIEASVAEWEHWTGMIFPESGSHIVRGALVPVEIDRERDLGVYVEPNVWMRHSL